MKKLVLCNFMEVNVFNVYKYLLGRVTDLGEELVSVKLSIFTHSIRTSSRLYTDL